MNENIDEELEQLTLNAIAHISASKALKKQEPLLALSVEIFNVLSEYEQKDIKQALNNLCRKDKITFGKTVNDYYFKIKI